MDESSEVWNVRFELTTGGYTFTRIKREGNPIGRDEVEDWAAAQIRANDRYLRVDEIYVPEVDRD